ncbi:hypothetical protein [Coraliomargarita parva]|uniref:hypothetical protein n=1 Tax=Coraliomargarita parva TaxID=3014050 RepID=UPI0022B4B1AF|nr:hypothetical protein [Coraliomargarita parva]
MDSEAKDIIDRLLDTGGTEATQKAALKRAGELLEEHYILNLPPSTDILKALAKYSKSSRAPSSLARRAARLHKDYKI